MKLLAIAGFAASLGRAQDWVFNYDNNGADWGAVEAPEGSTGVNLCGSDNDGQSPIILWDPYSIKGYQYDGYYNDFGYISKTEDDYKIEYKLPASVEVKLENNNLHLMIEPEADVESYFQTNVPSKRFEALFTTNKFTPVSFNFHHPSEHRYNNESFDLELQIVHVGGDPQANGAQPKLTLAILFSVDNYDKCCVKEDQKSATNKFFDSIKEFGSADSIKNVQLQELLKELDLERRVVYQGSDTVPPCSTPNHWQVVYQVYSIQKEHLDMVKTALTSKTGSESNSRVVQEYKSSVHKAMFISGAMSLRAVAGATAVMGFAALFA